MNEPAGLGGLIQARSFSRGAPTGTKDEAYFLVFSFFLAFFSATVSFGLLLEPVLPFSEPLAMVFHLSLSVRTEPHRVVHAS